MQYSIHLYYTVHQEWTAPERFPDHTKWRYNEQIVINRVHEWKTLKRPCKVYVWNAVKIAYVNVGDSTSVVTSALHATTEWKYSGKPTKLRLTSVTRHDSSCFSSSVANAQTHTDARVRSPVYTYTTKVSWYLIWQIQQRRQLLFEC